MILDFEKNMLISQMDGYFENNPHCLFFRRSYAFSVGFKKKPVRKSVFVSRFKTRTNSGFVIKLAERINHSLFSVYLMNDVFLNMCQ